MSIPLSLALLAGALAPLNPCGFPLLPAFLSFYVGAEEQTLPRAPNRIAQGLLVGLLVTAGFLGVFAVVGLPITYGASLVAEAMPWAGLMIGVTLTAVGLVALVGKRISLPIHNPFRVERERRGKALVLFGIGYGTAALGCTLPTFLALVGVSLGAGSFAEALAIFAAYGTGMAMSFMTLSLAAALLQQSLARGLKRLSRRMNRISGALLSVAGVYLAYFWSRALFGPSATLATDPLVGPITRFSARLETLAADRGLPIVYGTALVVAFAVAMSAWQRRRHSAQRRAATAPRGQRLWRSIDFSPHTREDGE